MCELAAIALGQLATAAYKAYSQKLLIHTTGRVRLDARSLQSIEAMALNVSKKSMSPKGSNEH